MNKKPLLPQNKWSWKYDECKECGTNKKTRQESHKAHGLCRRCDGKKRWNECHKNNPEFLKKRKKVNDMWRKNNPRLVKAEYQRGNRRLKFKRIIKNKQENKGRILKRNNGVQYRCDGCDEKCLIISPVNLKNLMPDLEIFKKIVIEECKIKK